jgi:hypothetical protein
MLGISSEAGAWRPSFADVVYLDTVYIIGIQMMWVAGHFSEACSLLSV